MFITLKEAASQAGIHENTARFYRDKYEEFFPYTGEGRYRKYAPATVDILKTIKMCYDSKLDADAVRERLREQYGVPVLTTAVAVQTPQEEFAAAVVERLQNTMMQHIDQALAQQAAAHSEEVKMLQKEIQELRNQILQSDHKRDLRDERLLRTIRSLQAEAKHRNLPFWKRWFKQD